MRHLILAVALAVLGAAPAAATCGGPGLLDRLTAEERAAFDATVAAIPYGEGLVWRDERDGVPSALPSYGSNLPRPCFLARSTSLSMMSPLVNVWSRPSL